MTKCQHDKCKASSEEKLCCATCSMSFHYDCLGISKANYNSLRKLATIGARWHCTMCLDNDNSKEDSHEVIKASFQKEF